MKPLLLPTALMISSGGFFGNVDKYKLSSIREMSPERLALSPPEFDDRRLPEMLFRLRLIDAMGDVLTQFTPELAKYVRASMLDLGIEFLPHCLFQGQEGDELLIENKQSGEQARLASGLTFCFIGKRSSMALETNAFGQVMAGRTALPHIFAAGDCSRYRSVGSNAPTAQSAVRKGKLCARNILRHSGNLKILEPYLHQDLGYVISLGPRDAIGWIGLQANVVGGAPAVVVKELVEAQHELLLAGIDTYLI